MTKQRIMRISLISILIFALLLGVQLLYKNQWLSQSVSDETQGIQGILNARVVSENGISVLFVQTENIRDLQKSSQELRETAAGYPIRFQDQRSEELEKTMKAMQFPLQEGLSRGNFVDMEKNLRELAKQAAVELDLSMDSEAIYVTLSKEQNQLVTVLERKDQGIFLPSKGRREGG